MASSGSKPTDAHEGSTAAASAAAFLAQARQKISENDKAGALISLQAVSAMAGCPPTLRLEACKLLAQTGDSAGAIECYVQAGDSYLNGKDFSRARQAFQAAHALDVHNLDVIFKLGQADVAEGRTQDGLAKFIDVLRKSNLKHVPALFEAGCIYQANGQFDQAMLAFKKVLDRDKNHVQASLHIGQLYQSKESMTEAIAHYIKAAQIASECQHWSSARQIADMVLALDSQNQKAKLLLADLDEHGHTADEIATQAPAAAVPASSAPASPTAASALASSATQTPTPKIAAQGIAHGPAVQSAPSRPPSAQAPAPPHTSAPAPIAARQPAHVAAVPTPAGGQGPAATGAPSKPSTVVPSKPDQAPQPSTAAERQLAPQVAAKIAPAKSEPAAPAAASAAPPASAASPASAAPAASALPPVSAAPAASREEQHAVDADVARSRQVLGAIEAQRQAAQADLELLLSSRDELQKALAEQRAVLETVSMRKHELDAQIAASSEQAAKAAEALEAARVSQHAQTSEVARAAREAAAAATASAAADKEALGALAAQRAALETGLEKLRAESAAVSAEKAAAQQAVRELTDERVKLSADVSALTKKMQDAKKLTDELEAANEVAGKVHTLGEQVAALEAKRAELQAQHAELASRITSAESAARTAESAVRDGESAAQEREAAAHEREAAAMRAATEAEATRDERQTEADAIEQKIEVLRASLAELELRAISTPPAPAAIAQANVGPHGAHARAAAHLAAGQYEKAIEAYKQALEANPQDASAAYQAGALLAEGGGDLRIAEDLLSRAADLRPEHAATRYQLAVVKARRGNVVDGVDLLTALVRADSNNGEFIDQFIERMEKDTINGNIGARFKLGVAYRELGRVEEALVTLQAIQHEKEYIVPCLIAIGLCLRRQGLDGAAAKRFAKAIETPGYAEPLYLEALYNLGDLYEAKGVQESLAQALASFEEVYARDCTYRDVAERVRVVKTNLSSAERTKVKRLPTRMADSQGNQ